MRLGPLSKNKRPILATYNKLPSCRSTHPFPNVAPGEEVNMLRVRGGKKKKKKKKETIAQVYPLY